MSKDKWIVDYETPDGARESMAWESERKADEWLMYHRGQSLLFNMTKRCVTNWRATPSQVERALHGQLGTQQKMEVDTTHVGTAVAQSNACPHCGLIHETTCWRIKSLEYYPDGVTLKRIELHEQRSLSRAEFQVGPAGIAPGTGTGSVGGTALPINCR